MPAVLRVFCRSDRSQNTYVYWLVSPCINIFSMDHLSTSSYILRMLQKPAEISWSANAWRYGPILPSSRTAVPCFSESYRLGWWVPNLNTTENISCAHPVSTTRPARRGRSEMIPQASWKVNIPSWIECQAKITASRLKSFLNCRGKVIVEMCVLLRLKLQKFWLEGADSSLNQFAYLCHNCHCHCL